MKVELNPIDPLSRKIYDMHKIGADKRSSVPPCSLCRNKPEGAVRGHPHGSELGQCMLRTYNDWIAGATFEDPLEGRVTQDDIDGRAAFLLDGHLHEENIIKNIEASGMDIIGFANEEKYEGRIQVYSRENNGKEESKWDFVMPNTDAANREKILKGFDEVFMLVVHLDALLEVTNKKTGERMLVGIECKAVKEYTWKKIRDTSEISNIWYGQMQAYFLKNHNIARFYLIIKHRHTSQLMRPILITRNDKYINRRLNILNRVYNAVLEDNPKKYGIQKEHDSVKNSECKFCPYNKKCWGEPELNTVSEDMEDD